MLLSLITLAVEMPEACVPFGAKMVDFTRSNLPCNTLLPSFSDNLSRQGSKGCLGKVSAWRHCLESDLGVA